MKKKHLDIPKDESIYWNLGDNIVKLVYAFFKWHNVGTPTHYTDDEWEDISNKIIAGCEAYIKTEFIEDNPKQYKKWLLAKKLIFKNFQNLWN